MAAYLHQRFAGKAYPAELARLLQQRTQGNPLFVVTVVDGAVRRGVLREGTTGVELEGGDEAIAADVPDSLHQVAARYWRSSARRAPNPTSTVPHRPSSQRRTADFRMNRRR